MSIDSADVYVAIVGQNCLFQEIRDLLRRGTIKTNEQTKNSKEKRKKNKNKSKGVENPDNKSKLNVKVI